MIRVVETIILFSVASVAVALGTQAVSSTGNDTAELREIYGDSRIAQIIPTRRLAQGLYCSIDREQNCFKNVTLSRMVSDPQNLAPVHQMTDGVIARANLYMDYIYADFSLAREERNRFSKINQAVDPSNWEQQRDVKITKFGHQSNPLVAFR